MDVLVLVLLLVAVLVGLAVGLALGLLHGRHRLVSDQAAADQFRALSHEALERSSDRLASVTDARLRESELLVKPLQDSLGKVERQLTEVERDRTHAYADLQRQVTTMTEASTGLRQETAQLVAALRAPQVRGRWGEVQLRRVVEVAGMVEHCDFVEQPSAVGDDGTVQRPDLVVRLAGGKQVVVDAKVSFVGYLEAMEARDEATRAARLKAHARHLRTHVDSLAAKRYWERFDPAPEFAVMFVPSEVFLSAALDEDPALLEHAFERNVVVATPSTLVALLRTVGYTWRQEALAANAREVFALGRDLHARLATLGSHVDKLGSALNRAVEAYNSSVGSLEGRVLVTARKFADLKLTTDELATPRQVSTVARVVQAPELFTSPELMSSPEDIADKRYGVLSRPGERDDRAS